MQALKQMGSGFIVGAVSLILVIGGISLALAESSAPSLPPTPTKIPATFSVEFVPTQPINTQPPVIPTNTVVILPSATATPTIPPPVSCNAPAGWIAITVGTNDTLYTIAQRYNTTVEELNEKNCLNFVNPTPGRIIYVPPVPTKVVVQCFPPATWVKRHVVQPGENLFRIALSYGITYPQLQTGNCMGSSTTIFVGQVLWVPNVPTITPTKTPINTPNPATTTNTPTNTPDFSTPTATFIVTSSPLPTSTFTPTPSFTPTTPTSP